jgi:hypothetical protein
VRDQVLTAAMVSLSLKLLVIFTIFSYRNNGNKQRCKSWKLWRAGDGNRLTHVLAQFGFARRFVQSSQRFHRGEKSG